VFGVVGGVAGGVVFGSTFILAEMFSRREKWVISMYVCMWSAIPGICIENGVEVGVEWSFS
jgi:hypothetical protein